MFVLLDLYLLVAKVKHLRENKRKRGTDAYLTVLVFEAKSKLSWKKKHY